MSPYLLNYLNYLGTFPRAPSPRLVINPICPILASEREKTPKIQILYLRTLPLIRSAQADNQKMYIKSYNDQILGINGDIYSPNRVGSWGLSVTTKFNDKCFQRRIFYQPAWKWRKPDPQLRCRTCQQPCSNQHFFCNKAKMFNKLTIETLGSRFTFT